MTWNQRKQEQWAELRQQYAILNAERSVALTGLLLLVNKCLARANATMPDARGEAICDVMLENVEAFRDALAPFDSGYRAPKDAAS
jgi:hypothetical protein